MNQTYKEFELILLIKGRGEFTINGVKSPCEEGDIFLIGSHDNKNNNSLYRRLAEDITYKFWRILIKIFFLFYSNI